MRGVLVSNMGYDATEAKAAIAAGAVDAVAFGTAFLAEGDPATFYSPGPAGYTDYPRIPSV
jgi:N-ethylmaleimide reductase